MEEQLKKAKRLQSEVQAATGKLRITELAAELSGLQEQAAATGFWDDSTSAQETMKHIARLEVRTQPWLELEQSVRDSVELLQLEDQSLQQDIEKQIMEAQEAFALLKQQLKFSGQFDEYDAILSIHAGAGGTDAQDWAQMLMRMYVRWAEAHEYEVRTVDESAGEEAGIKSVTLEVSGDFVFGKLKGEHGVHRLVRLSPFNADSLRQTSFAKVEVMPRIDRPGDVIIDEKDLKIDVYRSGGHGGQSVNTTDSAVRITHLPTNIVVAIQNERSQLQNKETALTILRSKLAQLQLEQHLENLAELKGPNEQAAWGNQIRSYVLHPYKQVKDLRTRFETSDPDAVLGGKLDNFINAYLEYALGR
ncbi:MAG TPA: peptide chain release factor 2 [Candidatus Limnocylindria bacterium]|nr:peptide chain release factor 2 [Candidatus Limnocylindria bacterium]